MVFTRDVYSFCYLRFFSLCLEFRLLYIFFRSSSHFSVCLFTFLLLSFLNLTNSFSEPCFIHLISYLLWNFQRYLHTLITFLQQFYTYVDLVTCSIIILLFRHVLNILKNIFLVVLIICDGFVLHSNVNNKRGFIFNT